MQDPWNTHAYNICKRKDTEARLEDFILYLEEEVDQAADPLYSREATFLIGQFGFYLFGVYLKKPVDQHCRFLFKSRLCCVCCKT